MTSGQLDVTPFDELSDAMRENARLKESPATVDDDHFTWWFDEFMATARSVDSMSTFEIAQAAWNEAVKRMKVAR